MHLVTGGAGFIGCNLVGRLLADGHEVRVLDNFSTGRRENLSEVRGSLDLVEGDLRSYHTVSNAMRGGIDVVFHIGALPSVPRSIADPITTNEVNVQGTLNVLHAALDHGIRRVVFSSSSSIYGDTPGESKSEQLPVRPLSPYAVSKLAGERYCGVFHRIYGLETVSLRLFNVFGPHQDPGSQYSAVIPLFIAAAMRGEPPVIHGDGEQSRDFTYVDNVVEASILAADAADAPGRVINAACGSSISVNDLAASVLSLVDREDLGPLHAPERPGDVRHSRADISLARELLEYEPVVPFREGLRRTVEHFVRLAGNA